MKNARIVCNVGVNIVHPQQTEPVSNLNTKYQTQKTDQKGITIIALIITIIVMLILASVTIYVGTDSIGYSKVVKFVSYMQAIQKQVDLIAEYEDYTQYGDALTYDQKTNLQTIIANDETIMTNDIDSTYLKAFNKNKISSDFEIDDIDDEIVVNFQTREVISLRGIMYEGVMYYTQYNLPGGQKLETYLEVRSTPEIGTITSSVVGLNGTFTISEVNITNGTLSLGKKDGENIKWQVITNKTKTGESITTGNIIESGIYYFKLVDNVTGNDNGIIGENNEKVYPSQEIRLTNSPKIKEGLDETTLSSTYNYSNVLASENSSKDWAKIADNDGKKYVWIPRFAYIVDENNKVTIEFLRGNSDVTTSGGYIDSNWIVHEAFSKNGVELTGVWVLLTNQDLEAEENKNLDIIEILSNTIL